jgi:hypothetical protein
MLGASASPIRSNPKARLPRQTSAEKERLIRVIVNRLRIQHDLNEHPEILAEWLAPPLIVSRLPRVGSTKLHHLLPDGGAV